MKVICTILCLLFSLSAGAQNYKVLVFSKTKGFRHGSIGDGVKAIQKLGSENNFAVDHSEDSSLFTIDNLLQYKVIIFLSTTGDILDASQQKAFEGYIQSGGGFVGIHAATDTEYDWPWYTRLVGGQFASHPQIQDAELECVDHNHSTTKFLPKRWKRKDEWYNFKNLSDRNNVLLNLDEKTYTGGKNGENHPAAWYKEFDGGRMFYTAGGHTNESYKEDLFMKHILAGIQYAAGGQSPDRKKSFPEDDYFDVKVVGKDLVAPMEFTLAGKDKIFIIERGGTVKLMNKATGAIKAVHKIEVQAYFSGAGGNYGKECGGLGIAADPDFDKNGFLYIYYSPKKPSMNRLSRFTFKDGALSDEKMILEIPTDREKVTCHEGGSVAFGNDRMLYLSTGDNTCPFESNGFAPIDERPNRVEYDAQKSAGNSNDLRGSVLRIKMNLDGTYDIPEGNLWPKGTAKTRPEIYVKGCRNPYRISIDKKNNFLYWGDVGPDSGNDGDRGPRGYDEFNQARKAAYYGWPYFRGDCKPYKDFDFATGKLGKSFAEVLVNNSPNNTGLQTLPKPTSSLIWYPAAKTDQFPEVGSGGRSAMAGPAFHKGDLGNLPEYFDNTVIFYEWSRGFVKLVKLDAKGDVEAIHPFLSSERFIHPTDMEKDENGDIYILDYGAQWFNSTPDGVLRKVSFMGFNRAPKAVATTAKSAGAVPFSVKFSSEGTMDKDAGDKLTYSWDFGNGKKSSEANPSITYDKPGIYKATLTVTDQGGRSDSKELVLSAGNEPPVVKLKLNKSGKFSWNEVLNYEVSVTDKEDAKIDPAKIRVTAEYMPHGLVKNAEDSGDPRLKGMDINHPGTGLLATNNCVACHNSNTTSIGPAYKDVAFKYGDSKKSRTYLREKIQKGGGGVWGHALMPPHVHVKPDVIDTMVDAILALKKGNAQIALGKDNKLQLSACPPNPADANGVYVVRASYTDMGANGILGVSGESETFVFQSPGFVAMINGSNTVLGSKLGKIQGNGARHEASNVGYYSGVDTSIHWTINHSKDEKFKIQVSQATPMDGQNEFKIICNGVEHSAKVVNTGNWQKYQVITVGEFPIKKGANEIIFKPVKITNGALANIRDIRLVK